MIGNAPHSVITDVPGWETSAEQHYLVELAKTVPKDGLIVELGAEFGQSASLWSYGVQSLPHGPTIKIVSIDTFQGDMLTAHRLNLAECGFKDRTDQIVSDSKLAGESWGSPIDLLFIDADHSYAGCKSDIDLFTPHVKVGGLVVFHDVAQVSNLMPHHLHFEVTRALSEWQQAQGGDWEPLKPVDTIAVFRRVKPAHYPVDSRTTHLDVIGSTIADQGVQDIRSDETDTPPDESHAPEIDAADEVQSEPTPRKKGRSKGGAL